MAIPKYKGIRFGPGAYNNKNYESEWFVEPRAPYDGIPGTVAWSISTTYAINAAVTYNGTSYNSLQSGNIGNQPDISPLWWAPVDGKDGDVWVMVPAAGFPTGGDADIYVKANNKWAGTTGAPITVSLTDGQLVLDTAFEFPATLLYKATVEYTVKRGSGHGRKRRGTFEILNDGSSNPPIISHEYNEIGTDVNVPFTVDLNAGKIRIRYTSTLEGVAITCKYTIKGWA